MSRREDIHTALARLRIDRRYCSDEERAEIDERIERLEREQRELGSGVYRYVK